MATTGQKFPTVAVSVAEAPWDATDWDNIANVYSDDGAGASFIENDFATSYVLKLSGFDFSTIPNDSIINGITVRFAGKYISTAADINLLQLLDTTGARVGENKAETPIVLTTTMSVYPFGNSSDTWGNTLTTAWVKDAGFGIALAAVAGGTIGVTQIDYFTVEVHYTVVQTTGRVFPTITDSVSESPWSNVAWTNHSLLTADDNTRATVLFVSSGQQSQAAKLSGFDLSEIPDNAVIKGVIVTVEGLNAYNTTSIGLVQLLSTTAVGVGDNKALSLQALSEVATEYTFGGHSDLWGNALTPAWLKDVDFGVRIGCQTTSSAPVPQFDFVAIEVFYTVPKVYWIIAPSAGWSDPIQSEILLGQKSGGVSATVSGSSLAPTVDQTNYVIGTTSGLESSTAYRAAAYWDNQEGLTSDVLIWAEFTTSASGEAPCIVLLSGNLSSKSSPSPTDKKIFLNSGSLFSRETAIAGDVRLTLDVSGNLVE